VPDLTDERLSELRALAAGGIPLGDNIVLALLDEIERLRAELPHGTERIEIAREFLHPVPGDLPIRWNTEMQGEPDLTQPPPSASRPHPMRWVSRTVIYGPWCPVGPEPAVVMSGGMAVEVPASPDEVDAFMAAINDPKPAPSAAVEPDPAVDLTADEAALLREIAGES
jgi:hypothetical protein